MGETLEALHESEREIYNRFSDLVKVLHKTKAHTYPPCHISSHVAFVSLLLRFRKREHRLGLRYRSRLEDNMRLIAMQVTDEALREQMYDVISEMETVHDKLELIEPSAGKPKSDGEWSHLQTCADDPKYKGLSHNDLLDIARRALCMGG